MCISSSFYFSFAIDNAKPTCLNCVNSNIYSWILSFFKLHGTFCVVYIWYELNSLSLRDMQVCLFFDLISFNGTFFFVCFFFSIWIFFHDHSRITGLQGKGEGLSLTPYYHFTRFTDTLVSERKPLTTKPRSLLRMLNYANSTSGYENWCFFILSSLMLKQVGNFRKFGTRCTKVFVDRLMFLDFSKSGMQYLWQG